MQSQAIGSAGVICAQCAVCQDRFGNSSLVSVLLCGHAFHQNCLNRWIASSHSCPQCRKPVRLDGYVQRVFFDVCEFNESTQRELDSEQLAAERQRLIDELRTARTELKNAHEFAADLSNQVEREQKELRSERSKRQQLEADFSEQRKQVAVLREFKADAVRLRKELEQFEGIQTILKGTETEFEALAAQFGLRSRNDEASRSILNWLVVLRGELSTLRSEKSQLLKDLAVERRAREDVEEMRRTNATLTDRCVALKRRIEEMQREHRAEVERVRSVARKLIRAQKQREPSKTTTDTKTQSSEQMDSTVGALSSLQLQGNSNTSFVSDAIRLCVESPAPRSLITPYANRRAAGNQEKMDVSSESDEEVSSKRLRLSETFNAADFDLNLGSDVNANRSVIVLDDDESDTHARKTSKEATSSSTRSVNGPHRSAPTQTNRADSNRTGFSHLLTALKRNENHEGTKLNRFAAPSSGSSAASSSSTSNYRALLKRTVSASKGDGSVVYDGFGNVKRTISSSASRRDNDDDTMPAEASKKWKPDLSAPMSKPRTVDDTNRKPKQSGKAISDKNLLLNYLSVRPK